MKRPISVTIISWVLLVASALRMILPIQIFLHPPKVRNPQFSQITHILLVDFFTSLLLVIACVAILRAKNWGRWMLLVLDVLFWGFAIIYHGLNSTYVLPFIVTTVLLVFFFLPNANAYFLQDSTSKKSNNQ